jgi:ABC-type sugar transport system, permease component
MRLRSILLHSVLVLVAGSMLAPLGWMLLLSLRSYPEQYATLWALLQAPTTLANYVDILTADAFGRYMANSFLVAGCITVGNLLFSFAGGYALARFRGPWAGSHRSLGAGSAAHSGTRADATALPG